MLYNIDTVFTRYFSSHTHALLQVKNSSLKIMQAVCEKLHIPTRTARLYPFGQPPAAEAASAEGAVAVEGGMLDEPQVSALL